MQNNLTTFYIVRHGQTEYNKKEIIHGITDSELTDLGIKQASNLAVELKNIKFDFAFSSDLLRAKRTAEIIILEKNLELETTKLLRERHHGSLEGKPRIYYDAWDKALKKITDEEKYVYKHGKEIESDKEVVNRFIRFIREISIRYPGKTILAACHAGVIKAVLTKLGYGDYNLYSHGLIENGAYFVLESDGIDFFIKKTAGIKKPAN